MVKLTPKSKNISRWYTEVIKRTKLADYGPVKGTMVIRPYGYAIWENIQREFNQSIKALGVRNAYFPMFIPASLLELERGHMEGFTPELAVVTHGGGKRLIEPLVVRPTSETIMYAMYAKWISSWRDLPIKINQWNNVVRWEKRTYLFLRTLEFLWQEGHTAHATKKEAVGLARAVLDEYVKLYKNIFAIPSLVGKKSEAEKFAGASETYSVELLMSDGKILQGATSHYLGDNFSKVFNIKFQDKQGKLKYVHQTSWGLSTRSIGGLILVHGDNKGLVLPPKLAPTKAVVIPVLGANEAEVLNYAKKVKNELEKAKSVFPGEVELWDQTDKSYGWKINEAELLGIPLKIAIGPKEVSSNSVSIIFRLATLKKRKASFNGLDTKLEELLAKIQRQMYSQAQDFLTKSVHEIHNYADFKKKMKTDKGFLKSYWCGDPKCEEKIKSETKASTRLIPFEKGGKTGKCIYCGKKANQIWYFGQAY